MDLYTYVAGEGTRLFDDVPKSYRLALVSSTAFSNGIVGAAVPPAPLTQRPHDEWQSGERRYLSEGSMAQLKPTSDTGGIAAIDSGKSTPRINLKAHHSAGHCLRGAVATS
jgi:hypothetical protein